MNLLGRKNLKDFAKNSVPYEIKEAGTPLTMKGAFGSSSATAKEIVTLSTLRLTTAEGPVEFKNTQLYLLEKPDELISARLSQMELVLTSTPISLNTRPTSMA